MNDKEVGSANWIPLETKFRESGIPATGCAEFMWMWRDRGIEFYKHIDTRGTCYSTAKVAAGGNRAMDFSCGISRRSFAG